MEPEFILLIISILCIVFVAALSWYGIRISKNDEPDYPHNLVIDIYSVIGLIFSIFSSLLLIYIFSSLLLIYSIAKGDFDPENRLQTKIQEVTSVEKSGDNITVYNSNSYKIVIDLKEDTENLYHNSEKLENVTINGYWNIKNHFQDIKNKVLLVNTVYKISKKGDVKSVFIEVVEDKNKDDFKVEY